MSKGIKARATLVEIFNRVVRNTKSTDKTIYTNGHDNLYPNTLERIINQSPTARRCSSLMSKYIYGKGLLDENYNNLHREISRQIAKHYGAFIWVGYGVNDAGKIIPKKHKTLDYKDVRKQIDDDNENTGRYIYNDWEKENNAFLKANNKSKWYYPFNTNQEVLKSQIIADYGRKIESDDELIKAIKKFRGQVYFINLTPEFHYPLPPWDCVFDDMDSEARISTYTNTQTRLGFLGNTMLITGGLDEESEEQINNDFKKFMGAENSANAWFLNLQARFEDVDKQISIKQLKPQFDDKLFEKTTDRLIQNISGQFNNVPEPLIYSNKGALFGTNSETYKEMKRFYWEQNEDERQVILDFYEKLGIKTDIIPIT